MEPDREKIENLTKKDEKIYLVAGVINSTGKTLYWKNERYSNLEIGEYAIVRNMAGYDLIKIIGILETTEKEARKFLQTDYENMKEVVFNVGKLE